MQNGLSASATSVTGRPATTELELRAQLLQNQKTNFGVTENGSVRVIDMPVVRPAVATKG